MQSAYAQSYRDLYQRHWWWRAREAAILATIRRRRLDQRRHTILDVGCGDALLFDRLASLGEVHGVEVDETLIDPNGPWRDRIYIGPFDESFQPGKRFSLITMLDVLEHLPNRVAALGHLAELLTDDGELLMTVPAFRSLWTAHDDLNCHYTRYTKASLAGEMVAAGLAPVEMRYLFHWTFPAKLAVRLKESLLGAKAEPPRVPARPINAVLYGLSRGEQLLFDRIPAPLGSSLLAVAQRA